MKEDSTERPVRVGLISLGCAKNLVDAEIMVGTLLKDGVEITSDAAQADVVIVNTCSFIDSAQEESVDTILESAELREAKHRGQGLIVAGCLPQRFRDELPALLPEVDAFMGIDQVTQVTDIVRQALARRADRLGKPKSEVQSPKSKAEVRTRSSRSEVRGSTRSRFSPVQLPRSSLPSSPLLDRQPPPPLHPRLRDPALPADAAALRLRQDRRGLQSSVQLLHHPPHAGLPPQPPAGRHRRRSQGADCRRGEGAEPDLAGLDLLRPGPAPGPQPAPSRRRRSSTRP